MLADTEAEVAGLGEVALLQLILLDLEATLQDLLGLGSTDGDVDGDLFVTTDTEGTDGVAGLACAKEKKFPSAAVSSKISHSFSPSSKIEFGVLTVDRSLPAQLLKHLGSTSESVTRFADGDVENQLLDAQFAHRVRALVLSFRLHVVRIAGITGPICRS